MANGFINDNFNVEGELSVSGSLTYDSLNVSYDGTTSAPGETRICVEASPQVSGSTGGTVNSLTLAPIGSGSASVTAVNIIGNIPFTYLDLSYFGASQGWKYDGGYTDTTTAFGSSGTNVEVLASQGDIIYFGNYSEFDAISVDLLTPADADLGLTFEYSIAGPGWTAFTPTFDYSEGFTKNGLISFDKSTFSSWASVDVNGGDFYYIRITRGTATLGASTPTEKTLKTCNNDPYGWDEDGNFEIDSATVLGTINVPGNVTIQTTGPTSDSPRLYIESKYGGTTEVSRLRLETAEDPYLQLQVAESDGSPWGTAVLNIYDNKLLFDTDDTVDIGADGANRPKNIYASGLIKSSSDFELRGLSSGYTGSEWHYVQGSQTSVSTAQPAIFTIAVPADYMIVVKGRLNGIQDDKTDAGCARFTCVIRNTGAGTSTIETSEVIQQSTTGYALISTSTGTGDFSIHVVGVASETWYWVGNFMYQILHSDS